MTSKRLKRKLTAIFYTDLADYSRLTGEDEEGTHRHLSRYLDAITASIEGHGGTILHFAGDAVLAEFASAVEALNCAVNIQRDLKARNTDLPEGRKLKFRIGINLGDVIVDRNEIYGDGVNVAARLESLADPAGICISGVVHDLLGSKLPFAYEFMGEKFVKNIAKPVLTYRVIWDPGDASAARAADQLKAKSGPALLRRFPAFSGFPESDLEVLAKAMSIGDYNDGHLFIREGAKGDTMFLIIEGQVLVSRKKTVGDGFELVKKMGAGEMFGLISLIDSGLCTASCRAVGAVKAASLPRFAFDMLFNMDAPIAHHFQYLIACQLVHDVRLFNELLRKIVLADDETKIHDILQYMTYLEPPQSDDSDDSSGHPTRIEK